MNSTERKLPRKSLVGEYIATNSNNSDKSYSVETFVYKNEENNKYINNQEEAAYLGQLVNSHTSYKLLNDSLNSLISSNNNHNNNTNNSKSSRNRWPTDKTNNQMDSFEIEEVVCTNLYFIFHNISLDFYLIWLKKKKFFFVLLSNFILLLIAI
jgi:hypothetical protein